MLLHALIPASRANGPGLRAVIFFQGCSLGCKRCWNPQSHPFHGIGYATAAVETVADQVLRAHREYCLEGVTFSGGEPMQQADSLLALLGSLHQSSGELSFGMFTGYTERELDQGRYSIWQSELGPSEKTDLWQAIRVCLDFAVLGRFNYLRPGNAPFRTSRNQVLRVFSRRYCLADFTEQLAEVHIDGTGQAEVTGFPILGLPW
jgi:anaerobic ribonucleoside-triphosphate reductase activating protein